MLATLNEDTARRVAEDVRDFGAGYIRIDHEGRATHVPSYCVVAEGHGEVADQVRRMHE